MNEDYKRDLTNTIQANFLNLEQQISSDIVRRIVKMGEITSTADLQINRLMILGNSTEDVQKMIQSTLNLSNSEMTELYDQVIDWEYVRNASIYEQVNADFIPYSENTQLQQLTNAYMSQSYDELGNITKSLGFYVKNSNGVLECMDLASTYTQILDSALIQISAGGFDYNSVLKKTVKELTNSGLRTIDYASGKATRVEVAARRAVMTGVSNLTADISNYNAEKLGTDSFEVAWHANARPTHQEWQGKVYTKEQLTTICGLGTVTGLLGANCYHEYYPFIVGISERSMTDEEIAEANAKENTPDTYKGKEYTSYQATQKQRSMEVAMRAQRETITLLKEGEANSDDITLSRAKYMAQLDEYKSFSATMGLTADTSRIYIDGLGRVA